MKRHRLLLLVLSLSLPGFCQKKPADDPSQWTIYIANDACSDYTWGFNEQQTRKAFADVVRAHLDEMLKTDKEIPENRDHYNMSVTQEADAFLEYYPERKDELIRRIHEGRVAVGAVYDNALWGFQSTEGMIRAFYPARRLEKAWGIPMDVVEHMEQPGLPWGAATIIAGSGFRWVTLPYFDFDSTFSGLTNPPLFRWTGPDGATIGVRMDKFASEKAHYTEGAYLLHTPSKIADEWVPHYQALRDYPPGPLLASGSHGDNNPNNGARAAGFADAIVLYNAQSGPHPKLVNATFPMFFHAVDASGLWLPSLRGDFGDSWDVWPVTLASYASKARLQERAYLAAESLLALSPADASQTRKARQDAEWNWTMLADHAWNGTDDQNRRVNAELRHHWGGQLEKLSADLTASGWNSLGLVADASHLTLYNPLSVERSDVVVVDAPAGVQGVSWKGKPLESQIVEEDGKRNLYLLSPSVPGFGFVTLNFERSTSATMDDPIRASSDTLENRWYRLVVDPKTGGLGSLVDKATGKELRVGSDGSTIGQTVFFDGTRHTLSGATSALEFTGPLLARLKISGEMEGIAVVTYVTAYRPLNRIDFDTRIHKPLTTAQQRLTQVFPVAPADAEQRLETVGAVIRPQPQPAGDLLPGADTHRFAVQGFVDVTRQDGLGVTIAPREAFFLRKGLEDISFEVLGNDQDFAEMSHDQNGVTDFRFRYSLRSHAAPYDNAGTVAWSRGISNPFLSAPGQLSKPVAVRVVMDPRRGMITALKPAEDGGSLVRVWETAGQSGPALVEVDGFRKAVLTDLLERPIKPLAIKHGKISIDLKAHGMAAMQLLP